MNTFERVRSLIAATLRVPAETVNLETKSEDLASWDSLGHVNLMIALEQTFEIYLDVEEFSELNSVRSILAYLEKCSAK